MISCSDYDYIEIACTYHIPILLTLKSGEMIDGIALDTARNENREECIKVKLAGDQEDEGNEALVVLDHVVKMKAKIENPHFSTVTFA